MTNLTAKSINILGDSLLRDNYKIADIQGTSAYFTKDYPYITLRFMIKEKASLNGTKSFIMNELNKLIKNKEENIIIVRHWFKTELYEGDDEFPRAFYSTVRLVAIPKDLTLKMEDIRYHLK